MIRASGNEQRGALGGSAAVTIAFVLVWALVLAGCATARTVTEKTTETTPPGETPEQAAVRLFPVAYKDHMDNTGYPQVLKGATGGPPYPVAENYIHPELIPASWVIDYDPKVQRGLFERMRALETSDATFLVPMMKDGLTVDEFQIFRDDMGEWSSHLGPADPLPGGRIHKVEEARTSLQGELGQAAEVRVAVFLPTGLVFAVGRHGVREAAVYLTYAEDGPGHTAKNVFPPEPGRLFTSAELPALFEAVMTMPSDQPNGS